MDYFFKTLEARQITNDRIDDMIMLWKITLLCKYGVDTVVENAQKIGDDYLFDDLWCSDDLWN